MQLSHKYQLIFDSLMNMLTDDERQRISKIISNGRQRAAANGAVLHSNVAMDHFAADVKLLRETIARETHLKDTQKHAQKATLLALCEKLDELCPYELMPNSWFGVFTPLRPHEGASIRDQTAKLAATQQAYRECIEIGPSRRNLFYQVREQSAGHVEAILKEIGRMREEMQPKHDRTILLSNTDPTPVIQFAKAFVRTVNEDRAAGRLKDLPHIDRVAQKTACYLNMLTYVAEVEAIARRMSQEPFSFWNKDQYESQLAAASNKFKSGYLKQVSATAKEVLEFELQDRIIRTATDGHTAKVATEFLKDAALTYIAGAPSDHKLQSRQLKMLENDWENLGYAGASFRKPKENSPVSTKDKPKLFSRIEKAYWLDDERYKEQLKRIESYTDNDFMPAPNPVHQLCNTMSYVYAARWARAADKIEKMVASKHAMLENPRVDTLSLAATHVGHVSRQGALDAHRCRDPEAVLRNTGIEFYGVKKCVPLQDAGAGSTWAGKEIGRRVRGQPEVVLPETGIKVYRQGAKSLLAKG